MDDTEYDFIVIGSGFGGSVSALRLVDKGYRVAVIEMGTRHVPEEFPKTSWNLRKFLWKPSIGCHGILQLTLLRDVFVLHGAGVGGGSLMYANTLLVPPTEAFRDAGWVRPDFETLLAPHYATAKRMLGVVTAPEIYAADEVLKEVCDEMGRGDTFRKTEVGVFFGEPGKLVPDPFFGGEGPDRAGCVRCGGCMVGCRFRAKNTLDQNYLYLAEKRGAVVMPELRVTAVVPRADGGYEVRMRRSIGLLRPSKALRAKNVVFAAGVLGTVPLLMKCRTEGLLPRLSDRLGDRVRTNSEALVGVRSTRPDVNLSHGIAIAAGVHIDKDTHVEVVRYSEGSDFLGFLSTMMTDGEGGPWVRRLRWILNMFLHPINFLRTLSPFGWAKKTAILLVMQSLDNYLRLHWKRRWFWPFGRGLVSARETDRPIPVYFPAAHEVARRMAKKLDGIPQSSNVEILLNVPMTAHILGGCPMGKSESDGVIDEHCRVFGYDGLYVVDGSAIPSNLGVNPSLTITALAEHAMTQIPEKAGRVATKPAARESAAAERESA